MKKAAGFRTIALHGYKKIDWEIVYTIITERTDDFRKSVKNVLPALEEQK
jgi:uncharacterized protein YutE (UPF0331/DUF86 family)